MKDSIRTILCVMAGIFLMQLISALFFFFTLITSIASSTSSTVTVPQNAVLKIDMSKLNIVEKINADNPFSSVSGLGSGSVSATVAQFDVIRAIDAAAADPAIKCIYIRPEGASGITSIEEIRASLTEFRRSGKSIIAFMDNASTGDYYLSSVADKIYMNNSKGASAMIFGLSGRLIFLKDILDYVGVNMQLIRHGKYKSAGEMYIANKPSEANLEQTTVMIKSLWATVAEAVAESRGISIEKLNYLVDNLSLNNATDMLDNGLVDGLLSRDEMKQKLAEITVEDSFKNVKMISLDSYIEAKKTAWEVNGKTSKIAIIFADGQINEAQSGSRGNEIVGNDFAEIISKVRNDESITAVVLRVNSPGGSVLASDKIKQELNALCEAKPVVASYGGYAASGGYWISCGCRYIFSNKTTLTGSIGVFSMVPDLGKVINKAKVNIVPVNSNKHSDMLQGLRPLDNAETAYMQKSVEEIYDTFTSIVAEGRSKSTDYIDSIAQGRVWTGSDALEIGLVDGIGTLKDAVLMAGSLSGNSYNSFSEYNIVEYPKTVSGIEVLMELLQPTSTDKEIRAMIEEVSPILSKAYDQVSGCFKNTPATYALLPYYIDIL
ncbi:MAG: signal peptide peptidase SppA [Bacteroidales bacterium]|nr:signal peptide peptidase SppA [Bacteroidales bacterium]